MINKKKCDDRHQQLTIQHHCQPYHVHLKWTQQGSQLFARPKKDHHLFHPPFHPLIHPMPEQFPSLSFVIDLSAIEYKSSPTSFQFRAKNLYQYSHCKNVKGVCNRARHLCNGQHTPPLTA